LGVNINISPLVLVLEPDEIATSPPVFVSELPAIKVMVPPATPEDDPTVKDIDPLPPWDAYPVPKLREPLEL
jgi:hypothetical protein